MKTKNEITELNYNDLSFFTGKSLIESKWTIADILMIEDISPKGLPKIKITDKISVSKIDFKIKSNSNLEGKSRFEYLCDFYNKGIPLNTLREMSESKTFIKALKFTASNDILNHILNKEQYLKLQKTWLFANVFEPRYLTEKAVLFIKNNEWAYDYLAEKGIRVDSKRRKTEIV